MDELSSVDELPARGDGIGPALDDWLAYFNEALDARDPDALAALFEPEGHWRDVLAFTWRLGTVTGREAIGAGLADAAPGSGARGFAVDPGRCPPREVDRAGIPCVEAILSFGTVAGPGAGVVRFRRDAATGGGWQAWSLLTALEDLAGHEEATLRERREPPAFQTEFHGPNWVDRRREQEAYDDRDPAVLVVGGGHAGLTAAARLGQLGVDTLVIDREARVGDNWRLRYHALKLHNRRETNHLPYLPFPETWPTYIPKDMVANWLEFYADAMEINFWTRTALEGAAWDEAAGRWTARLRLADGTVREMRPRHIVMATSVSGTPHIPEVPTLDRFGGTVLHSSQFEDGGQWRGKGVLVLGTGTSAHDIAQDLHGHGARVTMVQRSPTLVVNIEPSAQLYDGIYSGEGPPLEDRDLLNASFTLGLIKTLHQRVTERVKEIDRPLLERLEKAGFRLEFGEDDTGWPLKYRTRGGGYYFNVGCSELIADGAIGLVQYDDLETFTDDGARLKGGRTLDAELVVLATGYKGQDHLVRALFGEEVAKRIGPVWGFDPETQELHNMWTRTAQPGLWFTAGAFSQCRIYSKYLALQIKAEEEGLPVPGRAGAA